MDSPQPHPPNPLMSPAKQQRILIWRNEVASALCPPDAPSLASSASTATTTNTNTTTSSSSSDAGRPPRSSLWKRLSARFRSRTPEPLRRAEGTAMYRSENAAAVVVREEDAERSSEERPGRPGGFVQRQDRLIRAARLLNRGESRMDDAP